MSTNDYYLTDQKLRVRQMMYREYSRPTFDLAEWIVRRLNLSGNELILDVGCGNGTYHRQINRVGGRVIAFDNSMGMLEAAKREATACVKGLVNASAEDLPFGESSFDGVMANYVLYHIDRNRLLTVLANLRQIMKPGAKLVAGLHGSNHLIRLRELHVKSCESLGLKPNLTGFEQLNLTDVDLVSTVFPDVVADIIDASLVIPTVDKTLYFYMSFMVDFIFYRPEDNSHIPSLEKKMKEEISSVIRKFGEFREEKPVGCFIASRDTL